jgi:hypothetical protein
MPRHQNELGAGGNNLTPDLERVSRSGVREKGPL